MRITWQKDTDMAYLHLKEFVGRGEVARTVLCDDEDLADMVNIDLDSEGRILGIEIAGARRLLSPEVLSAAEVLE